MINKVNHFDNGLKNSIYDKHGSNSELVRNDQLEEYEDVF